MAKTTPEDARQVASFIQGNARVLFGASSAPSAGPLAPSALNGLPRVDGLVLESEFFVVIVGGAGHKLYICCRAVLVRARLIAIELRPSVFKLKLSCLIRSRFMFNCPELKIKKEGPLMCLLVST